MTLRVSVLLAATGRSAPLCESSSSPPSGPRAPPSGPAPPPRRARVKELILGPRRPRSSHAHLPRGRSVGRLLIVREPNRLRSHMSPDFARCHVVVFECCRSLSQGSQLELSSSQAALRSAQGPRRCFSPIRTLSFREAWAFRPRALPQAVAVQGSAETPSPPARRQRTNPAPATLEAALSVPPTRASCLLLERASELGDISPSSAGCASYRSRPQGRSPSQRSPHVLCGCSAYCPSATGPPLRPSRKSSRRWPQERRTTPTTGTTKTRLCPSAR